MIAMKKAIAWNWIVNGLIVGIIVIAILSSILSKIFIERARQDAQEQMTEIYAHIDTLCDSSEGDETSYNINIPDIVEMLYVSPDKNILPEDIDTKVKKHDSDVGTKLCMKLREEAQKCKSLSCEAEMSYLGQKKTVLSLAESILSMPKYTEFSLYFTKNECGVSVLTGDSESTRAKTACIPEKCGYNVLLGCNRDPMSVLVDNKMVLLADTTPFCTSEKDCAVSKPAVDFAIGIANKFNKGRNNLLIIWEDKDMDPARDNFKDVRDSVGLSMFPFRHNSKITSSLLSDYDQVWIFRPGWCYGEKIDGTSRINDLDLCTGVITWADDEIQAFKEYLDNGGSIFLTTDHSSITDEEYKSANNIMQNIIIPQDIAANKIVGALGKGIYFDKSGCYCGCRVTPSTNYAKHPLVSNIKGFVFNTATRIKC